jgi:hypothetical protein
MAFEYRILTLEKAEHTASKYRAKKFLIVWRLNLDSLELQMISKEPKALEKGLSYLHNLKGEKKLDIFRIISLNEVTNFEGKPNSLEKVKIDPPNGIAILNANSLEDARDMISHLIEGLTYGGLSIKSYISYEIKPLLEIGDRTEEG